MCLTKSHLSLSTNQNSLSSRGHTSFVALIEIPLFLTFIQTSSPEVKLLSPHYHSWFVFHTNEIAEIWLLEDDLIILIFVIYVLASKIFMCKGDSTWLSLRSPGFKPLSARLLIRSTLG